MSKAADWLAGLIQPLIFRHSLSIIVFFLLAGVVSAYYTSNHLGINSNTAEMFDSQLGFRKNMDRYKEQFPLAEDNFMVVVSGAVPEIALAIADSITNQLKSRPDLFVSVFQPVDHPFFRKNQLLFLDSASLGTLSQQAIKAKPMMTFLSGNYSLKGLFSFLGLMIRYSATDQLEDLGPLFQKMDSVLLSNARQEEVIMSWQGLMGSNLNFTQTDYHFIQVTPVLNFERVRPAKDAIEAAKSIVSPFNQGNVSVRITGKKAMTYEEMGSVMDGAIQASLLALVMVALVLWLGLRSFRLIAASLITLVIGLLLTAAFSTWAVGQLNMISVAFAVLYIGLGVDYSIHLCLRYRELGMDGASIQEALSGSITHIVPALLLSTLSTAIGFYAFLPTDFVGVSELGLIAGTGMFISLLVTLLLLPSLIWKMSGWSTTRYRPLSVTKGLNLTRNHSYVRYGTYLLGLLSIVLVTQITFDYDPINLRDPKSESVATAKELIASGSLNPRNLNLTTRDSSRLSELSDQLKSLPEVGNVLHINRFVPRNQKIKLRMVDSLRNRLTEVGPLPLEFQEVSTPDQLNAIKVFSDLLSSPRYQELPLFENFGKHLKVFGDSLQNLAANDQEQAILKLQAGLLTTFPLAANRLIESLHPRTVTMGNLPKDLQQQWISNQGDYRIQVFPKPENQRIEQLGEFVKQVISIQPEATGDVVVTLASGDTVIKAFRQALIYAIVAIAVLLMIYLKSLKDTFYILFPLILAGFFTGAFSVILSLDFNFANIIAIPVLLGLGVDNGVRVVHRAKPKQANQSLLQSSAAPALLFRSLPTLFHFGNLAFSPHKGTASMGLLLTIGVIFILITTLLILPAFMGEHRAEGMEQKA